MSTPAAPTGQQVGTHFNVVSAIPMTMLVAFVVALLLTGAPADAPSLAEARRAAGSLTVVHLGLLVLAGLALGLLTHPLQRALVCSTSHSHNRATSTSSQLLRLTNIVGTRPR